MADDFYDQAARRQYQTLQAARSRVLANLEEHRSVGNDMDAAEEIQTLAVLNDQMASLERLHQQYNAQRNPSPVQIGDQEFMAMSPERMAQNPELVERVFQKSKYYDPNQWNDPEVRSRFMAGIEEVKRRRRVESGDR